MNGPRARDGTYQLRTYLEREVEVGEVGVLGREENVALQMHIVYFVYL